MYHYEAYVFNVRSGTREELAGNAGVDFMVNPRDKVRIVPNTIAGSTDFNVTHKARDVYSPEAARHCDAQKKRPLEPAEWWYRHRAPPGPRENIQSDASRERRPVSGDPGEAISEGGGHLRLRSSLRRESDERRRSLGRIYWSRKLEAVRIIPRRELAPESPLPLAASISLCRERFLSSASGLWEGSEELLSLSAARVGATIKQLSAGTWCDASTLRARIAALQESARATLTSPDESSWNQAAIRLGCYPPPVPRVLLPPPPLGFH
ncbi:hypothetical protein T484DRAFT_1811357 [Baffinella frigidus]|nr:hypothetical protein T484DRAFT_1811357 [Cryptophyta sp. CCMP2293]